MLRRLLARCRGATHNAPGYLICTGCYALGITALVSAIVACYSRADIRWLRWLPSALSRTFRAEDSWQPIADAVAFVDRHTAGGLYDAVYYHVTNGADQFIYSPLALAVFDLLQRSGLVDWGNFAAVNRVSWFAALGTGILTAFAARSIDERLGDARPGDARGDDAPREPHRSVLPYLAVALPVTAFFYPVAKGFALGQIQSWLNLLVVAAIYFYCERRTAVAGALLGLAAAVKPNLGLVLLWSVVGGEYALAAGMFGVLAILSLISLWIYGLPVHLAYLELLKFLSARGESYYASHAFNGLLNRALFLGNNLRWDGTHTQLASDPLVGAATKAWAALLIIPALFVRGSPGGGDRSRIISLGIVLLTTVLASPVAYEHHFGFILPIYWIAVRAADGQPAGRRSLLLIATAASYALCAEFLGFTRELADSPMNFVQSYMLFGGMLLLATLYLCLNQPGSVRASHGRAAP